MKLTKEQFIKALNAYEQMYNEEGELLDALNVNPEYIGIMALLLTGTALSGNSVSRTLRYMWETAVSSGLWILRSVFMTLSANLLLTTLNFCICAAASLPRHFHIII